MEWKNVRKWLLIMLVLVDLFLAGNLIRQVEGSRQSERQALLDAVTVAQRRGVTLDSDALLDLPAQPETHTASRSDALEQTAADALLGQGIVPEGPGGGVTIYRNDRGQLSFRRGGALELELEWSGEIPDQESCSALLSPAGLAGKEKVITPDEAGLVLTQYHDGLPIVNGSLTLRIQEGILQLRGRWLLDQETAASENSLSRAQLVLSLCALLEGGEDPGAIAVSAGYYLQGEDASRLTLVPIWVVETARGQLFLSCVTGEELIF